MTSDITSTIRIWARVEVDEPLHTPSKLRVIGVDSTVDDDNRHARPVGPARFERRCQTFGLRDASQSPRIWAVGIRGCVTHHASDRAGQIRLDACHQFVLAKSICFGGSHGCREADDGVLVAKAHPVLADGFIQYAIDQLGSHGWLGVAS